MTMVFFNSAGELKDYVVANTILQADIVTIIQADRQWYLFHY